MATHDDASGEPVGSACSHCNVALDSGPVLPEQSPIPRDAIAGAAVQLADAVDQTSELLMATTELHGKVTDLHANLTEALVDLERVLAESTTDPSA